ncbi:DNA polymerase I [Arenicella chitinivorans]|uniref:DNA polymerase I n=1 Tax=Arenicella chitinivorans TaxID=1329800 RepID=A0A918RV77_9GAMM|nr:DNA polymerase I [Arenicella chitinivorans]GHA10195.1 DNA polymerase I [Arenicella chitinivorans]
MKQPELILIDGSSYLYRAFYVPQLKRMQTTSGQPTGAVFGIINMIKSLMSEYPESHIVAVFDAKGKNFRHDLYEDYKANRPPMPDELRSQIDFVHRGIKAMGLPLVAITGVEADDVIGTYAKQASEKGKTVLVASGDKDLAQIVNDRVNLIDTMKKVIMDVDGVVEKFGVRPDQIIDFLTLTGDTSDNIPGVPKVGPKTAVKWLSEYDTLDGVIENADQIGGKVGENLREFIPQLPLSKDLVTIRCELELDPALEELHAKEPDTDTLIDIYQTLQFKKWLGELGETLQAGSGAAQIGEFKPGKYSTILNESEFEDWLSRLASSEGFAFDTETTSVHAQAAELVGLSFAINAGEAAYVPVAHSYLGAPDQLDRDWVLQKLKPLLEDPNLPKIGQNLKYDMSVLANYSISMQGVQFDTMLESYVLNSVSSRHDMDTLSETHLGHTPVPFTEVAGKGKSQLTFDQIELETASRYAAEDADVTLRLHHVLMPQLTAKPGLHKIFTELEMPLVSVLSRIEDNGVLIDDAMLLQQSQQLAMSMQQSESRAYELAEGEFNLASPKQIQEILYDRMGLPVLRKTPKGAPSTAEDVLQELALDHELPRLILEHRSLGKLKSTYTDKLPTMINRRTGRVHTSYHQAVAATGRLSSSDPNLQNIPIRTLEGRRIREAFIAEPGCHIVAADYSQIELRIMAHLSADATLLDAFQHGLDIHRATAAEIFSAPLDDVTDEQRRHSKAVNFGLIYGMSAFGLAKQLNVERKQAQSYIDQYFERYPGVKAYMENTRESARERGFVETVFGRRLYLPDINAKNHNVRQYAERTAINAPMQGTAADIIKMAMIAVDQWIRAEAPQIKMVMQVHDELVFEVPDSMLDSGIASIRDIMQQVAKLDVPLLVDVGNGSNWAQAH